MGGFVDHFMSSAEWPQDVVFTGSPWAGGAFSLTNPSRSYGAAEPASAAVDGAAFPGVAAPPHAKLHEQLLGFAMDYGAAASSERAMMAGTALGSMFDAPAACQMALTESAPVICSSSSNESRGSEQSALPGFLVGEQHVPAWPAAYAGISSMAGEETQQSFGFDRLSNGDLVQEANANKYPQLQLHDDIEFDTGKLLSFAPGQLVTPNIDNLQIDRKDDTQFDTGKLLPFTPGQQVTPITGNLQIDRKEFSGAHHLNLSSLISGPHASFSATQSHSQPAEAFSGKTGSAAPFVSLPEAPNGNGGGGNGAPKPRVRARRGQATDPHSIAERLRREKISDRMNNLQELVPNSNKTDKASMLDEIIDYVKFLQLQVKVLSMSRLGAAEAVVPLLTERQTESLGLLLSPRSAGERQQAGAEAAGGLAGGGQSELQDGGAADAFEHEVVQLMENNMTAAMQYLQSKGLCLMPVALASAISTQKGTSSAAVRPENAAGAPKAPRGRSLKETKSIA